MIWRAAAEPFRRPRERARLRRKLERLRAALLAQPDSGFVFHTPLRMCFGTENGALISYWIDLDNGLPSLWRGKPASASRFR